LARWGRWLGSDRLPDVRALLKQKIPMGPFLAVGSLMAVFWN
jgi:hypothetical protein